jgi:hypothetical protein
LRLPWSFLVARVIGEEGIHLASIEEPKWPLRYVIAIDL